MDYECVFPLGQQVAGPVSVSKCVKQEGVMVVGQKRQHPDTTSTTTGTTAVDMVSP
jgi:hypothetical protein